MQPCSEFVLFNARLVWEGRGGGRRTQKVHTDEMRKLGQTHEGRLQERNHLVLAVLEDSEVGFEHGFQDLRLNAAPLLGVDARLAFL